MKNRITIIFTLLLLIILGTYTCILYDNNSELAKQVEDRDKLIKDAQIRDSLTNLQTQKNADVFDRYVNDCSLEINGKKITLEKFVKILNDSYKDNNQLQDSVFNLNVKNEFLKSSLHQADIRLRTSETKNLIIKDSLDFAYHIINSIKKKYGIEYSVTREDKYLILKFKRSTIDSALILFPHFKDRLSFDSSKGSWLIRTIITNKKVDSKY